MSFGFSVGDLIAVGRLSLAVYRSCRDAPESFSNISMEVLSLHAVLTEIGELLSEQDLSPTKQNSLAVITQGCDCVLKDLQALVLKYESLGTQSKRTWDRMRWGMNDVAELRSRLISNIVLLTAFMSTFQAVVERKLNKLATEFQDGKMEGSVISTATFHSLADSDQVIWRDIRKELENIGISVAAFDSNKAFIMQWFQDAIANGAFEESSEPSGLQDSKCEAESLESNKAKDGRTIEKNPAFLAHVKEEPTIPDTQVSAPVRLVHASSNPSTPKDPLERHLSEDRNRAIRPREIPAASSKKKPRIISLVKWVLQYDKSFQSACRAQDFTAAKRYLSKGARIDGIVDSRTALYESVRQGDLLTAGWLLERGAHPGCFISEDGSRISYLSESLRRHQPDLKMAQLLLDKGADVNDPVYNDMPILFDVLMDTSHLNHFEIVGWLLDRGVDVKKQGCRKSSWVRYPAKGDRDCLQSPLHIAASYHNTTILKMLLDKGEDINVRDSKGRTALHVAAASTAVRVPASWFLDQGADIESKDLDDQTPLFLAVLMQNPPFARSLLELGASVNIRNVIGTAFRQILQAGRTELALLFLEFDVDTAELDENGDTLLHAAAKGSCYGLMYMLASRGIYPYQRNFSGHTAFHYAKDVTEMELSLGQYLD